MNLGDPHHDKSSYYSCPKLFMTVEANTKANIRISPINPKDIPPRLLKHCQRPITKQLPSAHPTLPTSIRDTQELQAYLLAPNINTIISWDNCCSYHVTNNKDLLVNMHPIPQNSFSGVGGSAKATHAGYLLFLPTIGPDFPQTLLSLGQLHSCGGQYSTTINPNLLHVYAIDGDLDSLIDVTPCQPTSNTCPTTIPKLTQAVIVKPKLFKSQPRVDNIHLPPALRNFIKHQPQTEQHHLLALPTHLENTWCDQQWNLNNLHSGLEPPLLTTLADDICTNANESPSTNRSANSPTNIPSPALVTSGNESW